jgi:hypothetical protein
MLLACWSAKGGSGTSVVAATLALLLARTATAGALLIDLAGDAPALLGVPEPDGPGVAGWLAAEPDVGADALRRLEITCAGRLSVLAQGRVHHGPPTGRVDELCAALSDDERPVIADCGVLRDDRAGALDAARHALAAAAPHSLLVTRPCYLAMRRALAAPIRPSGVVLVNEAGRALRPADIEEVLGVPVRAVIDEDPAIARAVDAGLLASRVPKALARALRDAA